MNLPALQLSWILLYVSDVPASLAFYTGVLDLEPGFQPDGTYAELRTGSTTLALCDRTLAADSAGVDLDGPRVPTGNITFTCNDVPARFHDAVARGAKPVREPQLKPWGQTTAYVSDPDGHLIELATPLG